MLSNHLYSSSDCGFTLWFPDFAQNTESHSLIIGYSPRPTRHEFCPMTQNPHPSQMIPNRISQQPHLLVSHLQQWTQTDQEEENRSKESVTQWRGTGTAWANARLSLLIHQCGTLMSRRRSTQGSPHKCAPVWRGHYTEGFWITAVCHPVIKIWLNSVKLSFSTAECVSWNIFSPKGNKQTCEEN